METTTELSWWACLLLVLVAGAVGGVIGAVLKALTFFSEKLPDYEDETSVQAHQEMCRRMKLKRFYLGRSVTGIGGAFAAILAGTWIGKIVYTCDTENVMSLAALCVVAGTIAHKLIPGIGERLQGELIRKQMKNVSKLADERAEETEKTIEASQTYTIVISHADTAFNTEILADINLAIKELVSLLKTHPLDRTAHIYLGRLYRLKKDYNAAITTLRGFVENLDEERSASGRTSHIDLAAGIAYFNIACYHALKLREFESGGHSKPEISRLYNETLMALQEAIRLDPENLIAAQTDADLEDIREKEEVKKLLCIENSEDIPCGRA